MPTMSAVPSTFVVMPFTQRSRCPKCDSDRFTWRYRTSVAPEGMEGIADPQYPHLRMICERCRYTFNMECKDAAR
jgi:predicted nucleic-acid-binding Zn-ribbon protein